MSNVPDAGGTQPEQSDGQDGGAQAFERLGLGPEALRAVAELGFDAPTPVQERTIPLLLQGRDVLAQAPTGTGKTAAYGLPMIQNLDEERLETQALVIVPTRELAIQVAEAVHALGKYREAVTLPIYGGQAYDRQFRALERGVQVVAGTPGRLLDHLRRRTLDLSGVRMVVLDEADEMLDMGFIEDIEAILAEMPEERQTALFSATIPPRIASLAERYMRDPERVSVATRQAVAPLVRQVYYEVPFHAKPQVLGRILDLEQPESAIVFVRTRRDADTVAEELNGQGYIAQAIHGDLSQAQRERALERFRKGHTQFLVATDVAARGLDIPEVSHVINYDLPMDAEWYTHRIGRTGRAGRTGEALTLVTPRERRQLGFIERGIRRSLERVPVPTARDIAARRRESFREEVLNILDGGQLDPYLALVGDLSDSRDPAEIAAAAFKMAAQARENRAPGARRSPAGQTPFEMAFTEEAAAPEERTPEFERGRRSAAGPDRDQGGRGGEGMTRLFLRVGRRDGVRPADLVGAIANEAGVPGNDIGEIDIYDNFSFVGVPEDAVDEVLAALNRTTIRGRETGATIAKPSDDGQERDGGRDRDRGSRGFAERGRPWDRDPNSGPRVRRVQTGARRVRPGERRGTDRPFDRSRRGPRDYR